MPMAGSAAAFGTYPEGTLGGCGGHGGGDGNGRGGYGGQGGSIGGHGGEPGGGGSIGGQGGTGGTGGSIGDWLQSCTRVSEPGRTRDDVESSSRRESSLRRPKKFNCWFANANLASCKFD